MRILFSIFLTFFMIAGPVFASTDASITASGLKVKTGSLKSVPVYFFGRDDCKFCLAEKKFMSGLAQQRSDFKLVYYNIGKDKKAKSLFDELVESRGLSKVTPVALIGRKLIQGFDADNTTGAMIVAAIDKAKKEESINVRQFIDSKVGEVLGLSSAGCESDSLVPCEADVPRFLFTLPFVGAIDLETFSLFSLSTILGFVDGFNPCAMWVLVTFLLILLQIGDKKKMWQIVGLFLFAEAAMYFMILNVWYKTWDFIGLDKVVTPLIGILALFGGVFFLKKYFENRKRLICDITSTEHQKGVEAKIKKLIHSPLTIITAAGIIGIAFSVNIIEFACSVGIPQAFTKILELNSLSFAVHQFYLLVYTFFYMLDDIIVFGLALYSFNKLHTSYKYANFSALVGGILMLILGVLMLFAPNLLVF